MPVTEREIPRGVPGTLVTLAEMRRLVNDSLRQPAIVAHWHRLLIGCSRNDRWCQLVTLRSWIAAHWRFVRDPWGVEYIRSPRDQLAQLAAQGYITGDCDDAAILAASAIKAAGMPARFVVLGFSGPHGPFSHVFTEAVPPGMPAVEFDVTRTPQRPPTTRLLLYAV